MKDRRKKDSADDAACTSSSYLSPRVAFSTQCFKCGAYRGAIPGPVISLPICSPLIDIKLQWKQGRRGYTSAVLFRVPRRDLIANECGGVTVSLHRRLIQFTRRRYLGTGGSCKPRIHTNVPPALKYIQLHDSNLRPVLVLLTVSLSLSSSSFLPSFSRLLLFLVSFVPSFFVCSCSRF